MFFVYILYSTKLDRYYTGSCESIEVRLQRHNSGYVYATKYGIPWELKYFEAFATRLEAASREHEIKKKKSRVYILKLISEGGGNGRHAPI